MADEGAADVVEPEVSDTTPTAPTAPTEAMDARIRALKRVATWKEEHGEKSMPEQGKNIWTIVCPKPLIVRVLADRSSEQVGEMASGSKILIHDSVRMANGEQRVQVSLHTDATPMGWVTHVNNRGIYNIQPGEHQAPLGNPERRKLMAEQRRRRHMEGRPTTDSEEVEELRQLISSPNRESSLTAAAYMHFEVAADNALIAQKERDEKVERDQRIRAAKEERRRKVTEYAQSCRDVIINTKKVMQEKVTATKAQVTKDIRQTTLESLATKKTNQEKWLQEAKDYVAWAKQADSRLDKKEDATVKALQEKNDEQDAAFQVKLAEAEAREASLLAANRAKFESIRQQDIKQPAKRKQEIEESKLQAHAGKVREEELARMRSKRMEIKEAHMQDAVGKKAAALNVRAKARLEREEILKQRYIMAKKEKDNDFLVDQEKRKVVAEKKQRANATYRERYAKQSSADFVKARVEGTSMYLLSRAPNLSTGAPPGSPDGTAEADYPSGDDSPGPARPKPLSRSKTAMMGRGGIGGGHIGRFGLRKQGGEDLVQQEEDDDDDDDDEDVAVGSADEAFDEEEEK